MSRASDAPSIPAILRNDEGYYEGDLRHYFKVLVFKAQNLKRAYHNLRHMLHVTWLVYQAIVWYAECGAPLTPRQARNLLIAALFHDFDHSGLLGDDDLNLEKAVRGLRKNAAPEDQDHLNDIEAIMRPTEFPYQVPSEQLGLLAQILRDADMSQSFSVAWLQQVLVGLATEWDKTLLEILRMQKPFHERLQFHTTWAQNTFPPEVVAAKGGEAQEYLAILES